MSDQPKFKDFHHMKNWMARWAEPGQFIGLDETKAIEPVTEIADTFITNITQNDEFITQVTENNTFITNVTQQITQIINSVKGQADGVAGLDGTGKVPPGQLPVTTPAPSYGGPYGYGYRQDIVIATDIGVQPGTAKNMLADAPNNGGWFTNNANNTLQYQFPEAVRMTAFKIWQSGTNVHGFWFIESSNDGTNWTQLSRQEIGGALIKEYTFTNANAYIYYRIRHDDTTTYGHNGPFQQWIAFKTALGG
jgi:hypothetical protein